jgi:TPR repeat protein
VYFLALYNRHVAKEEEKAAELFIRAAELGMRESYADAGLCLQRKGEKEKAVKMFEKGSTEKIYACKYHLAMVHWEKKEFKEAFKLLREAVEHGESELASFQLGVAYMNGQGVEQDKLTAVKHLQPSAERGNVESQWLIGSTLITIKAKVSLSFLV